MILENDTLDVQHLRVVAESGDYQYTYEVIEKIGRADREFERGYIYDCSIDACEPIDLQCYQNNTLSLNYPDNKCDQLLAVATPNRCNIIVGPNPTIGKINIRSPCPGLLSRIYSLQGEIVITTSETDIDLSNMIPGVYMLVIQTSKRGVIINQIVKE